MALDLEEQEQVAELTAWWQQHGNLVVSAIMAAARPSGSKLHASAQSTE